MEPQLTAEQLRERLDKALFHFAWAIDHCWRAHLAKRESNAASEALALGLAGDEIGNAVEAAPPELSPISGIFRAAQEQIERELQK